MKYLYDIHYHAFNLSHANLTAFIERMLYKPKKTNFFSKIASLAKMILGFIFKGEVISERLQNTLAVLEYPIEDHFLIVEYYLKQDPKIITLNNTIRLFEGGEEYDKLVICPLMMDFGQKGAEQAKGFYKLMPGKPIVNQTIDLFNAIKNYYSYTLEKENGKLIKKPITDPKTKPLRIIPFLGINPENYNNGNVTVDSLFDQYFTGYETDTIEQRKHRAIEKSIDAFWKFDGILSENNKNRDLPNLFFGIKVYPPLGFEANKYSSITLFYKCLEHKIPVTTHCSDGGFITDENAESLTNPDIHWKTALAETGLNKLKLNYAHLGIQHGELIDWTQCIFNQMKSYPNIYADISSIANEADFYDKLTDLINKNESSSTISERLLFGTDFLINLTAIESYNHYLANLQNCKNAELLNKICTDNPERFLFGTGDF
jgi:hypothetical protein